MISCDEFLKILVEEDGGKTTARKALLEEHRNGCDDCRELEPTLKEAYEAEEDPTEPDAREEKIMAMARAHVAKEIAAKPKAEPKPPIRIGWWKPLSALAAVVVVGVFTMHVLQGPDSGGNGSETPGFAGTEAKTPRVRLIWAKDFHRQHDDEQARKYAKLVAEDPDAPAELREEARKLLEEIGKPRAPGTPR